MGAHRRSRASALAFAAALLLAASAAHAQDEGADRAAIARSLFQEGVALAQQERYAEASDRFRRAYALRPAPAIAYNLASALARDGSLVDAAEVLRRLLREPRLDEQLRSAAQETIAQIEPRIGRLTLRVEGDASGVEIALDERVLAPEALGIAIPVDPGEHAVIARRDGAEVAREAFEIAEGRRADVVLAVPARALPEVAAVVPADTERAPEMSEPAPSSGDDTGLWVGIGIGVAVAIAVGVTVAVLAWPAEHAQPVGGNTMPGVIEW